MVWAHPLLAQGHLCLILILSLIGRIAAQGCSVANPCEVGCCSAFGFCGFGPDFCKKPGCVADCDRKSECDPGHGKEWSKSDKCPLNVCCSKFGFCGTTKDFCGDKKVQRPSCSKDNGISRVIGYYEGWATSRSCNIIYPEQIPVSVYTHINFAFATIDPKTFKVGPGATTDINLYKRLMLLKQRDPNLRVMVAIGGWAFNDPGPTQTTFSDLAASVSRQKTFIESLTSFMATYGFDGLDLDWEYPRADDRAGRDVDYANFPKFLARLKSALAATGGRNQLSITLPASYWYLQHFDLKALAKEVSWFNIMSYDLHGMWDFKNKWTGPYLNAHTNLTEIADALDLIWRNDIKPDMVVLGLGFYGRAFRATSQSCLEPGCTFQETPAEAGSCSKEPGILLNSEIDQIVKERSLKPRFYKDAAVKVANWANQWVAYDDEETLGMKSEFAQSHCLGGLMVWAISHDTADAKYTKALAKVSNRRAGPQAMMSDQTPIQTISVQIPQCKWMGCGQPCPDGWIHMKRTDTDRKTNDDYMLMNMGCEDVGGGTHPLCCPKENPLPQCGWWAHNGGSCKPGCPRGMIEIGSTNAGCRDGYQSACCSTGTKSTQLYTTCEWGPWPGCDELRQCPWKDSSKNTQLVVSPAGIGGSWCSEAGSFSRQKRKMCCDTKDARKTFKNCRWYQEILYNEYLADEGLNTCKPTCPSDLVLVAQDWGDENFRDPNNPGCGAGMRAYCCEVGYSFDKTVENPILEEYRAYAIRWLQDATCPNPGNLFSKRDSELDHSALATRDTPIYYHRVETLLLALLVRTESEAMLDALARVWDSTVGEQYPYLRMETLLPFARSLPTWLSMGPIDISHKFLCLPDYWNERAAFWKKASGIDTIVCGNPVCPPSGTPDTHYVCLANLDDDDPFFQVQERSLSAGNHREGNTTLREGQVLERRGGKRKFEAKWVDTATGQNHVVTVWLASYPSAGPSELKGKYQWLADEAIDLVDWTDCSETRVKQYSYGYGRRVATEHLIEGQMIPQFIRHAVYGTLPNGKTPKSSAVLSAFFVEMQKTDLPTQGLRALPGGAVMTNGLQRFMEVFGSRNNFGHFLLLEKGLNGMKAQLMVGKRAVDDGTMKDDIKNNPTAAIESIRDAIAVINYLNFNGKPNAKQRMTTIVQDAYDELVFLETYWNGLPQNAKRQVKVAEFWAEWAKAHMEFVSEHTKEFCLKWIKELKATYGLKRTKAAKQVITLATGLEAEANFLKIDTSGYP